MNFSNFLPSLKYLCLLQALRRKDAKQFRDLYKVAVTRSNLSHDVNIRWLYFEDEYLVYKPELKPDEMYHTMFKNILEFANFATHFSAIISSGCAYAQMISERYPLSKALRKQLRRNRTSFDSQKPKHVSFFCQARNRSALSYNYRMSMTGSVDWVISRALLTNCDFPFSWNRSHFYKMHFGLATLHYVSSTLPQCQYYLNCLKRFQSAAKTWSMIARRLGICKDIRMLITRRLKTTLMNDECWGTVNKNAKRLKGSQ